MRAADDDAGRGDGPHDYLFTANDDYTDDEGGGESDDEWEADEDEEEAWVTTIDEDDTARAGPDIERDPWRDKDDG